MYNLDMDGYLFPCSYGELLQKCAYFICPAHFKCPMSYCIYLQSVCDGTTDCPHGEDEVGCPGKTRLSCPGQFRCKTSNICLPIAVLCDNITHCLEGDDEVYCHIKCPKDCLCFGLSWKCSSLTASDVDLGMPIVLTLTNHSVQMLGYMSSRNYKKLQFLLMNKCSLKKIPGEIRKLSELRELDISNNRITAIPSDAFYGNSKVTNINFGKNNIQFIQDFAFRELKNVLSLDLAHQSVSDIGDHGFFDLISVQSLNLSYNKLTLIKALWFASLRSLRTVLLRGNKLASVDSLSIEVTHMLLSVDTSQHKLCCLFSNNVQCIVQGKLSTLKLCDSDMVFIATSAWILLALCVLSTLLSCQTILIRVSARVANRHTITIGALALIDLVQSLLLSIILVKEVFDMSHPVILQDFSHLRTLVGCKISAFSITFNSSLAKCLLVLIACDRIKLFIDAFVVQASGSGVISRLKLIFVAAIISFIITAIPFMNVSFFLENEWMQSRICSFLIFSGRYLTLRVFLCFTEGLFSLVTGFACAEIYIGMIYQICQTPKIESTRSNQQTKFIIARLIFTILYISVHYLLKSIYIFWLVGSLALTSTTLKYVIIGNDIIFSIFNSLMYTLTTSLVMTTYGKS